MRNNKTADSTRDRILKAAIELFWEKGFEAASMAELLKKARANSGSFYYFFKSKEDLLLAVLDTYEAMLYPVLLEPAWEGVHDPIERVFALLARYRMLILQTDCTYGCPIGRLALEVDPKAREAHKKIAANFEGWSAAVRKCLEEAGNRLPEGLNHDQLAHFVLTVMEGGVMQSRSYRCVTPFDAAVTQLRDYFDRLLAAGSTAAASGEKQ
jgi:TetR/AcrR family transcriptional repressor of nem operon